MKREMTEERDDGIETTRKTEKRVKKKANEIKEVNVLPVTVLTKSTVYKNSADIHRNF